MAVTLCPPDACVLGGAGGGCVEWRAGRGWLVKGVESKHGFCTRVCPTRTRGLWHARHRRFGRRGSSVRRPDLKLNGAPQSAQTECHITSVTTLPLLVQWLTTPPRTNR